MGTKDILNFGKNLRKLMDQRGYSYYSLSKATGIPHSNLHDYVLGKHRIPLENAFKIAEYFDVSIDKMLEEDRVSTERVDKR